MRKKLHFDKTKIGFLNSVMRAMVPFSLTLMSGIPFRRIFASSPLKVETSAVRHALAAVSSSMDE